MGKWRILLVIAFVIFAMQLCRIDKSHIPYNEGDDYVVYNELPSDVARLLKQSCYDCHSCQTKYPWYSNVAPASWIIENNVHNGRQIINFSKWKDYYNIQAFYLEQECAIDVQSEYMPLKSYSWFKAHPKLTSQERKILSNWFYLHGISPDTTTLQ